MDLNYLFYRQQIERTLAERANSEQARKTHADLAREYEQLISSARLARGLTAHWPAAKPRSAESLIINPTMAVAMTAREVSA